MSPKTTLRSRRQIGGFTLVELLLSSTILIIGLTALTSLVIYSSKSRGAATKRAFAARAASNQLSQIAARGYDGLVASLGNFTPRTITDGDRNYTLSGRIDGDCNHAQITNEHGKDDPSFAADGGSLSAIQDCCPLTGRICCLYVEVDVNYTSEGADAGTITASTYVTKGCL